VTSHGVLNHQDHPGCYSRYEQHGLPWQDLRFGKNGRNVSMRQIAHDSDGDTSKESTVAVGESQAKSPALKATFEQSTHFAIDDPYRSSLKQCFAVQNQE